MEYGQEGRQTEGTEDTEGTMCTYNDVVETHSCIEPIGLVLNKDLVSN